MQSHLLIFIGFLAASLANPLPQSLTEEQFRSFGDDLNEPEDDNQVEIVSGYSSIARYGRGFDNTPLKVGQFAPLRVKSPLDLHRNINRVAVFPAGKAPVFDLQEMLKQQELKRRIEEVNRIEAERRRKAEEEAEANEIQDATTTQKVIIEETTTTIKNEDTTTSKSAAEDEYEYPEDEFDVTFAPMTNDDGFIRRGGSEDDGGKPAEEEEEYIYEEVHDEEEQQKDEEEEKPPMEIDLGSVQEV